MDCVFCKIIANEIPSVKVYEDDHILAFLDINPIEKGHVLLIPKKHWESLAAVPVADSADVAILEELTYMSHVVSKAVTRTFANGANLLQATGKCAGQTVFHLHFHVIPRYDDGSTPPSFESGHGAYSSNEERDAYAEKLRKEISKVLSEEAII